MSQWIYRIVPTRPQIVVAPTDDETAALAERDDYHRALKAAGILILAGPTRADRGTWGVTIFEAPDEASAVAVMNTDPAVSSGVMRASLYPYAVAEPAAGG